MPINPDPNDLWKRTSPREDLAWQDILTKGGDYGKFYETHNKWTHSTERALSLGLTTEEEARRRGWSGSMGTPREGESIWKPLPLSLYHVTPSLTDIHHSGVLKSRDELDQSYGHGLGGGASNTISFTDSHGTAVDILKGFHLMHDVLHDRETFDSLHEMARSGHEAEEPYHDFFRRNISSASGVTSAKDLDFRKNTSPLDLHAGAPRYTPLSENDRLDRRYQMAKTFLLSRALAGGPTDPLFFTTDVREFRKKNPKDFAIIHLRPTDLGRGYQMRSLGEWRTHSGGAVMPIAHERLGGPITPWGMREQREAP